MEYNNTEKRLTRLMLFLLAASNEASNLDDGTQFKIAERTLTNYKLEEHRTLEELIDTIVTECIYAKEGL